MECRTVSEPVNATSIIRDLAVEMRPVGVLKRNPRNARTHSPRQVKAIASSIRAFGFTNPVLVDDEGVILAGHGRFEAAKLLGLVEVPTLRIGDLNGAQKRAYVLADNRLAERAGWDRELLAVELGELSVMLPDLGLSVDLTGFKVGEIDRVLPDAGQKTSASPDDDIVPPPEIPVSRSGHVWMLGRHRIICGDSRQKDVVRKVLGDERIDLLFTDPPHGPPAYGHVLRCDVIQPCDVADAAGEVAGDEFRIFLRQVLGNAAAISRNGALHFVCMDWTRIADLIEAGRPVYGAPKDLCIWVKNDGRQRTLYRSQHELIALFKVGDGEHSKSKRSGRNRSNVWHYAGVTPSSRGEEEFEPPSRAQPVALVADAIRDVTRRDAIVLDPFGGSGTTLIAAERNGRCARLIEFDPRSVDVAVSRFQRLTKAEVTLAQTGATFREVAQGRNQTNIRGMRNNDQ
jgi:DNA methylase/ParB-like nuclease domain